MSATARHASTVCLIRDGGDGIEVLMVRRTPRARFMGGAWVFPGGSVDDSDGSVGSPQNGLDAWRAAAVRELVEETGIWLLESGPRATVDRPSGSAVFSSSTASRDRFDAASLRYFARWITPEPLPIRFDTKFFAAPVPVGVDPIVDGGELVDGMWVRPRDALERSADGTWVVAFPTLKTVEFFASHRSVRGVIDHIESTGPARTIQPRLAVSGRRIRILVPGDDGFESAGTAEQDPDLMAKLMQVVAAGGDVPPDFRPT